MTSSLVSDYLRRNALDLSVDAIVASIDTLHAALAVPVAVDDEDALYRYRVPEVSPDGACSLFDQLAAQPYDLAGVLGGRDAARTRLLQRLNRLVQTVNAQVGADWLGIYRRLPVAAGEALVKLACVGLPSRAEFPLDAAFAAHSNNSTVGLSGRGMVIDDVAIHAAGGGSYYVCDPKVRAEACLPVYAADGTVAGIIDAEAAPAGFFTPARQVVLVALCVLLSAEFA